MHTQKEKSNVTEQKFSELTVVQYVFSATAKILFSVQTKSSCDTGQKRCQKNPNRPDCISLLLHTIHSELLNVLTVRLLYVTAVADYNPSKLHQRDAGCFIQRSLCVVDVLPFSLHQLSLYIISINVFQQFQFTITALLQTVFNSFMSVKYHTEAF